MFNKFSKTAVPIVFGILLFFISACTTEIITDPQVETKVPTDPSSQSTETETEVSDIPAPSELPPEDTPPVYAVLEFETDFSIHSVPYTEIIRGGPSKDGIPSIDNPNFFTVDKAGTWLKDNDPVVFVQVGEDARAYPLQILLYHEIVNDTVGGIPLMISYCPLCNSAVAFERQLNGMVFDFGTTGRLRYSNLIMYDRQTESWWQQVSGNAIVGTLTGAQLPFYPSALIPWKEFAENYPDGKVLSYETGYDAPYGVTPYEGYDNVQNTPGLYRGPETPSDLPPLERVLGIKIEDKTIAYPFPLIKRSQVINDVFQDTPVVIFWQSETFSVLDKTFVWESRNIGSATTFRSQIGSRQLNFIINDEQLTDQETGSTWNLLGQATSGPLTGTQLEPLLSFNLFWFSWSAFYPETEIFQE